LLTRGKEGAVWAGFRLLFGELFTPLSSRDMEVNDRKNWCKNKKNNVLRISLPLSGMGWNFKRLSGMYLQPVLGTIFDGVSSRFLEV